MIDCEHELPFTRQAKLLEISCRRLYSSVTLIAVTLIGPEISLE